MTHPSSERSGRPRDPAVDERVAAAAMDVFAAVGWAGFTIDAVAREAGVGKASIYLRWSNKEDLLTEAVAEHFAPITQIDTGDLRSDLLALGRLLADLHDGRHGLAARRMSIESEATPGVSERWRQVRGSQVAASRAIIRRGIDRGEVPRETSVTLVLDTLHGAIISHSLARPPHLGPRSARARATYVADLVDFVLRAAAPQE